MNGPARRTAASKPFSLRSFASQSRCVSARACGALPVFNATARVESLTKYYGAVCLATREVHDRLAQPPQSRLIDRVVVKGKSTALELFEVRNKCSGEDFVERAKQYAHAFELYEQGRFAQAEKFFRELAGADKASMVLAERCTKLQEQPPSEWHGVFTLTAK